MFVLLVEWFYFVDLLIQRSFFLWRFIHGFYFGFASELSIESP